MTTVSTAAPIRYPLLIAGYALLSVAIYGGLYAAGWLTVLPNDASLLQFDAKYYLAIRDAGYSYTEGAADSAGFYPLFAWWWKVTGLGAVGISLTNALFYLTSLYVLCRLLRPPVMVLGLFVSLPFQFFLYAPLSEALYFAFTTGLVYGIVRKRPRVVMASLLLAGLTRASFLFLVPAVVGMFLMRQPLARVVRDTDWRALALHYLLPIVASVALVAWVQYVEVGDALAYYKTQAAGWGRVFGWPVFPLGAGRGDWPGHLSRVNFWTATGIALTALYYLLRWLSGRSRLPRINDHEVLALVYLTMSLLSLLLFNPEWFWYTPGGYNATYLKGINRYLQPNPFFLVFLVYVFRQRMPTWRAWAGLVVYSLLLWFTVSPDYLSNRHELEKIGLASAIVLPYLLYHYWRWRPLGYALILASFVLQAYVFSLFLGGTHLD